MLHQIGGCICQEGSASVTFNGMANFIDNRCREVSFAPTSVSLGSITPRDVLLELWSHIFNTLGFWRLTIFLGFRAQTVLCRRNYPTQLLLMMPGWLQFYPTLYNYDALLRLQWRGAGIASDGGVVIFNAGSLFQDNIGDSSGDGGSGAGIYCGDGCDVT